MPVTAISAYDAQPLDRQDNFHGLQLVYLCWEKHLMFCAPFTFPLPPAMPFSDFIEQVLRRQVGIASIQSSLALREIKAGSRMAIPKLSKD